MGSKISQQTLNAIKEHFGGDFDIEKFNHRLLECPKNETVKLEEVLDKLNSQLKAK